MAARILSRQVRRGRPHSLRGLPDVASGPAFATASGLLAWAALAADNAPALTQYTITNEDLADDFEKIPSDLMEQAKLKSLGYQSIEEKLGERFHLNPQLLAKLNPDKDFKKAGEQLQVPNVQRYSTVPATRVVVSKSKRTVTAFAADGMILAQYPATIGSEHDPLPLGDWKITGVQKNPVFNYNPDLFWDAKADQAPAGYMAGFTGVKREREPSPRVDADPTERIRDMDYEGVDVNLTLPSGWFGTWTSGDDVALEAADRRAARDDARAGLRRDRFEEGTIRRRSAQYDRKSVSRLDRADEGAPAFERPAGPARRNGVGDVDDCILAFRHEFRTQ